MSLLNVESYVFINVFYLVLFCIHVCVDDVIKKKKFPRAKNLCPLADAWKVFREHFACGDISDGRGIYPFLANSPSGTHALPNMNLYFRYDNIRKKMNSSLKLGKRRTQILLSYEIQSRENSYKTAQFKDLVLNIEETYLSKEVLHLIHILLICLWLDWPIKEVHFYGVPEGPILFATSLRNLGETCLSFRAFLDRPLLTILPF